MKSNTVKTKKMNNCLKKGFNSIKDFFYGIRVKIHQLFKRLFPENKNKNYRTKKRRNETIFLVVFLAIPIIQFLVCYVAVNINSLILSLEKYDTSTGGYLFYGLRNFKDVVYDLTHTAYLKTAFKNSILAWFIKTAIGLPINLLFAYVIYKKIPFSKFFQVVLFLPAILSTMVMSMMFSYFVDGAIPALARILFNVERFDSLFFNPKTAFPIQIFYALWSGFGIALILYAGAMSRIPRSIIEYGKLEGITLFQEFFHVCLPLIFDTISVFLVTGIAGIFIDQLALYNFFGEGAQPEIYTLGYYFYIKVIGSSATPAVYPYASAAGLIFSMFAAPVTLLVKHLLEKYSPGSEF